MVSILISALIFILSVVLAWLAGPLLHVEGTSLLILRMLLVLLGAAAATVILVLHFRQAEREAATKNVAGRLGNGHAAARRGEEAGRSAADWRKIARFPAPALHAGRRQFGKDHAVLKSGLDPELLAGQIYRDQDVIATPVVNLWYTQQCVIVEAGDAVRKSPALWSKLIRKTRPKAYRSAMGTQAPVRAAVVCISCEHVSWSVCVGCGAGLGTFHQPDAARSCPAAGDGSSGLRDSSPSSIGFPSFTEYVRNLTTKKRPSPWHGLRAQRSIERTLCRKGNGAR